MSGGKMIFFGAGAVVGGVIGALGTYFLMKKRCEKKVDDEINGFLENFYAENGGDTPKDEVTDEVLAGEGSESGVDGGNLGDDSGKKVDEIRELEPYSVRDFGDSALDYRAFYKDSGSDPGDPSVDPAEMEHPMDETDKEIEEREELIAAGGLVTEENASDIWCEETTAEMNSGKKPKLITSESYDDEYAHFDKIELEYYTVDDVLVDVSAEEEIADPGRIVGDCLDKYGFRENDDERVIFVRNFNHGADYEISKIFGRFYED